MRIMGDNIAVRIQTDTTTAGGLIIPDGAMKMPTQIAEVIHVGDGDVINSHCIKVGCKVLLLDISSIKMPKVPKTDLTIIPESVILAVMEEPEYLPMPKGKKFSDFVEGAGEGKVDPDKFNEAIKDAVQNHQFQAPINPDNYVDVSHQLPAPVEEYIETEDSGVDLERPLNPATIKDHQELIDKGTACSDGNGNLQDNFDEDNPGDFSK